MHMSTPATTSLLGPPGRAGGPASTRSGAPPGESPFAALLENDQARTATAEGPKNETPRPAERPEREPATERPSDDTTQADTPQAETPEPDAAPVAPVAPVAVVPAAPITGEAQAPVLAPELAAPTTPVTPVVTGEETAVPTLPTQATAVPTAPVAEAPAATPVAPAPATPVAHATVTEAQAATTTTAAEAAVAAESEAVPAEPKAEAPKAPVTEGEGDEAKATPATTPTKAALPKDAPADAPKAQPNPAANAAEQAAARTTAEPVRGPESAPVAAPQASSAAGVGGTGSPAAASRGAVPLERAAATVEAAMAFAARRGITHARVHLHPAELGAIEIHLRHSANGLTAHVVADSAQAAAALQQAGDDLRRVLESAGLGLLGLDIGARGDDQHRAFTGAGAGTSEREGRGDRNGGADGSETSDDAVQTTTVRTRVPLSTGGVLDVIA